MRCISRAHLSSATTPILVISFAIAIIILSTSKETKRKETEKGWIEGNEKFTDLDLLFSSSYLVGLRLSLTKYFLKITIPVDFTAATYLKKTFTKRQAVRSCRASEKMFNLSRDGR